MYTLNQVLTPEFPRSWHEAVALVQEVVRERPGMADWRADRIRAAPFPA